MGSWFSSSSPPLIILDLNKLLVYRDFKPKLHEESPHVEHLIDQATLLGNYYTFLRPHAREFVAYLLDHYRVAVWSSAWAKNVDLLCAHIFGERRGELLFEFDQTLCTTVLPHPDPSEKNNKPLFRKDLTTVWVRYTDYGEHNTIIIDDCPHKMAKNPEENVVLVVPWVPSKSGGVIDNFLEVTEGEEVKEGTLLDIIKNKF